MNNTEVPIGNLQVGAYGWRHAHWHGSYYPDDLPKDWQLSYYSNDFNVVMVPAHYWHPQQGYDDGWLEMIHANFRFFIELPPLILTNGEAMKLFLQQIRHLQAHLSGVILDVKTIQPGLIDQLVRLSALSPLFGDGSVANLEMRPIALATKVKPAELAIFDDDLTHLRQTRTLLEPFVMQQADYQQAVIIKNSTLKAADLIKFRSVIDIMGF